MTDLLPHSIQKYLANNHQDQARRNAEPEPFISGGNSSRKCKSEKKLCEHAKKKSGSIAVKRILSAAMQSGTILSSKSASLASRASTADLSSSATSCSIVSLACQCSFTRPQMDSQTMRMSFWITLSRNSTKSSGD